MIDVVGAASSTRLHASNWLKVNPSVPFFKDARAKLCTSVDPGSRDEIIDIEVTGTRRIATELLGYCRMSLDALIESFRNLAPKRLVPCCCSECVLVDTPYYHPLDRLEHFSTLNKPRTTSVCDRSGEDIPIRLLLEGYVDTNMSSRTVLPDPDKYQEPSFQQDKFVDYLVRILHAMPSGSTNINLSQRQETHVQLTVVQQNIIEFAGALSNLRQDLLEAAEDADRELLESDFKKATDAIGILEQCKTPEEVQKNSGPLKRLEAFIKKLGDSSKTLGKVLKLTEDGVEYAKDIAGYYNKIAEWTGLPVVPTPFINKK